MTPDFFNIIITAFILDLILGDPRWLPHPVKGMGWLANRLEPLSRNIWRPFTAGLFVTLAIVGSAYGLTGFILELAGEWNPLLKIVFEVFLVYTTLSARSLFNESRPVLHELKKGDLQAARYSLSRIVGRDTAHLSEKEITRATVETVSESFVDGILAPLFFAFLGGAPLAMAYKAINTLDSMFGYRNERYAQFGTFPARLDDAANWIPARLSALILPIATAVNGHNGWRALTTALRDGRNHLSPNSGFPEAAMAGALGIQLGGISTYHGIQVKKPTLGESTRKIEQVDIQRSQMIMLTASVFAVLFLCSISIMIQKFL